MRNTLKVGKKCVTRPNPKRVYERGGVNFGGKRSRHARDTIYGRALIESTHCCVFGDLLFLCAKEISTSFVRLGARTYVRYMTELSGMLSLSKSKPPMEAAERQHMNNSTRRQKRASVVGVVHQRDSNPRESRFGRATLNIFTR